MTGDQRPEETLLPEWARWNGEGPAPAKWRATNPTTGAETIVYRSYADYCMD
ncbi:hypothetical protein [Afifella sp. IM 167]|uniref:hypothetical protein n=1 Tax=Afifella sp. IM 167 TaxID=2033586 RepID=UPI001CCECCB7|nr:hypothetical protein [Afifella sp. IM 167]